jgi:hypothetical protein
VNGYEDYLRKDVLQNEEIFNLDENFPVEISINHSGEIQFVNEYTHVDGINQYDNEGKYLCSKLAFNLSGGMALCSRTYFQVTTDFSDVLKEQYEIYEIHETHEIQEIYENWENRFLEQLASNTYSVDVEVENVEEIEYEEDGFIEV